MSNKSTGCRQATSLRSCIFLANLSVECRHKSCQDGVDQGATIVGNNGRSEGNENWQHLDMNHLLVGRHYFPLPRKLACYFVVWFH